MVTIQIVNVGDSPNSGRVKWNDNDTGLQADIIGVNAALVAHEASSDHDSRYYTETEADAYFAQRDANLNTHKSSTDHDAAYVKKTGDETIAGNKTLTDNLIIKKSVPMIEQQHSDGSSITRLWGSKTGDEVTVNLDAKVPPGDWKNILSFDSESERVDIFNHDLYNKNEKVATEKYVQERVRTGKYVLAAGLTIASVAANTTYWFQNPSGDKANMVVPWNSIFRKISMVAVVNGENICMDYDWNFTYAFPDITETDGKHWIRACIKTGSAVGGSVPFDLYLYACNVLDQSEVIATEIFNSAFAGSEMLEIGNKWIFDMSLGADV